MLDRTTFFTYCRRAPFGGRLSTQQVEGLKCLLSEWETGRYGDDPRHLAYALATTFHETAATMQPIRERGGAAYFKKYEGRKDLGNTKAGDGVLFHGRGFVQLTGRANYTKVSKLLGIDALGNPDVVMQARTAARILFAGMKDGWFTGKRLSQFFNASADDPKGARKIINGTDKASLIAGYHEALLGAIKAADKGTPLPDDVSPEEATPDDVKPTESKSLWTIIVSALSGIGGLFSFADIDNAFAFLAFALVLVAVGVGVWLVATGRIEIKRSHAV